MWFHRHMAEPIEERTRSLRRPAILAAVVVLAIVGVAALAWPSGSDEVAVVAPPRPALASTTTTSTTEPPTVVPKSTPLATPKGVIPDYATPDGPQVGTVGVWYDRPMTMPIVEDRGAWIRIRLPERPNSATAWVRRAQVKLSSSAYRVVVDVDHTTLTVYRDGNPLFAAPVGVGKDATPTARGTFFVAIVEQPGPAGYGPVVLNTSGHSEAIKSWEGSGDAITAIHGSISASSDAQIGATGTKISNGCIRMHEADQLKLAVIPVGTPVDIV